MKRQQGSRNKSGESQDITLTRWLYSYGQNTDRALEVDRRQGPCENDRENYFWETNILQARVR